MQTCSFFLRSFDAHNICTCMYKYVLVYACMYKNQKLKLWFRDDIQTRQHRGGGEVHVWIRAGMLFGNDIRYSIDMRYHDVRYADMYRVSSSLFRIGNSWRFFTVNTTFVNKCERKVYVVIIAQSPGAFFLIFAVKLNNLSLII